MPTPHAMRHTNVGVNTSKLADQHLCANMEMIYYTIVPTEYEQIKWVLHLLFKPHFTGHALTW